MSDLAATNCGCSSENGCNSIIWIILLLCCCGGNGSCFGGNNCGGGNDCCWIIILLLIYKCRVSVPNSQLGLNPLIV